MRAEVGPIFWHDVPFKNRLGGDALKGTKARPAKPTPGATRQCRYCTLERQYRLWREGLESGEVPLHAELNSLQGRRIV